MSEPNSSRDDEAIDGERTFVDQDFEVPAGGGDGDDDQDQIMTIQQPAPEEPAAPPAGAAPEGTFREENMDLPPDEEDMIMTIQQPAPGEPPAPPAPESGGDDEEDMIMTIQQPAPGEPPAPAPSAPESGGDEDMIMTIQQPAPGEPAAGAAPEGTFREQSMDLPPDEEDMIMTMQQPAPGEPAAPAPSGPGALDARGTMREQLDMPPEAQDLILTMQQPAPSAEPTASGAATMAPPESGDRTVAPPAPGESADRTVAPPGAGGDRTVAPPGSSTESGFGTTPGSGEFGTSPGTGFGTSPGTPKPSTSDTSSSVGPTRRATLKSQEAKGSESAGELKEGGMFGGKYELISEIARGGMGVVYKARQIDLNRIVALKVMLSGTYASEDQRRRFILEAEASARLKHPHIVPVFDIGEEGGNLFFTMDFVEGKPLSKRRKELDRDQLLEVMIKVCDGVAYAHQRGIIHRDLKPDNVMMTADDTPLIMDFGLAKEVEAQEGEGISQNTREGAVMGTPHFMPPEQADGRISEIDVRTDVYALGVILYQLWTNKLPFNARSINELLRMIFEEDAKPPRQVDPTVDWDMEAVILKAIEKDKAQRYDTAADLKKELERIRDGLPITARRATVVYRTKKWARRNRGRLVAGGLVGLMAIGSAGFAYYKSVEAELRAQQEYEDRLAQAADARDALRDEVEALVAQERALFEPTLWVAGDPDASRAALRGRREEAGVLRGAVEEVRGRIAEASSPVIGKDDEVAKGLAEDFVALDAALIPPQDRLEDLERLWDKLERAEEAYAQAQAAQTAALEALEAQGEAGAQAEQPDDLDAALVVFEALLRSEADQDASLDASYTERREAFAADCESVNDHLYVALGIGQANGFNDSQGWVRYRLEGVIELRNQVAREESQVAGVRYAARLKQAARHLLALLGQVQEQLSMLDPEAREAVSGSLLRAARLAQSLVQAGLEANPNDEDLSALRLDANRVAAQALLDMEAYAIFDIELEAQDAFSAEDRAALIARKQRALEDTAALEGALAALIDGLESLDAEGLRERIEGLRELAGRDGMNDELERRRSEAMELASNQMIRVSREGARQAIAQKIRAAQGETEATPREERLERVSTLVGAWDRAIEACDAARGTLEDAYLDGEVRRCRLFQVDLYSQAGAVAQSRAGDVVLALELLRQALSLHEQLEGLSPTEEAQRQAMREQVARLERLTQKPEGMVLVSGQRGVELGGGERNTPHREDIADFYLGVQEVTCQEYARFLVDAQYSDAAFWAGLGVELADVPRWPEGWTSKTPPEGWAGLPVTGISWHEARGYARFQGMRLPTSDEWEYAARYDGGAGERRYPWGPNWAEGILFDQLKAPGENPDDVTPNGVQDMGGNVSEWVVVPSAEGTVLHAARGSSYLFSDQPRFAQSWFLMEPRPTYRGPQQGLRLAKDVVE